MEQYRQHSVKEIRKGVLVAVGLGAMFGLCAGMGLAGEAGKVATQRAREMPIEVTCQQLSERDTSVRLPDGSLHKLTCDENGIYGIPATQERRQ